MTDIWWW